MRRHIKKLAFVVGIAAGVALANQPPWPSTQVYWSELQSGTRSTPYVNSDGFDLTGITSVHLVASCSDNSQFTAGNELGWVYDLKTQAWGRAPTGSDCALSGQVLVDAGFYGPVTCPEQVVANPFGRFLWASSGVTCQGALLPDGGHYWDGGVNVQATQARQ